MSKRAYKSKDESTLRALGRKIIKYLDVQDGNEPEYVSLPD
jgi:hypothetical protein